MGSSWDALAWDDVAIHVANKKPNACHNEQEVIFFVMYHLGRMMATVVICALCSITAVIAQTYPPIKPYSSNSNSTKFPVSELSYMTVYLCRCTHEASTYDTTDS